MNGYERIQAALKGKPADKVPVMLHNFMLAAEEAGYNMEQFRNDPKIIAESFIKSVDKYQHDGILVDIDTVTLAGAVGVTVDFPVDAPARTHIGMLASMEQVKNLNPVKIENYKYIQVWLESVRLLKEYFKDEIFIRGNCDQDPFSLASMVRGIEDWMADLILSEEQLIFELLEYCTEATGQFIRLMSQTGADMISNGDSPAGPDLISPEMYVNFALPFEKKIVNISHSLGLPYTLHICGNTEPILDKMLLTGADAFELDYKTNVQKVFDVFNDKAVLIGNIDPSGVLALGSAELVRRKTLELLEIYGNSNHFILNAGCAIPPSTPSINMKTMIETARSFR